MHLVSPLQVAVEIMPDTAHANNGFVTRLLMSEASLSLTRTLIFM